MRDSLTSPSPLRGYPETGGTSFTGSPCSSSSPCPSLSPCPSSSPCPSPCSSSGPSTPLTPASPTECSVYDYDEEPDLQGSRESTDPSGDAVTNSGDNDCAPHFAQETQLSMVDPSDTMIAQTPRTMVSNQTSFQCVIH